VYQSLISPLSAHPQPKLLHKQGQGFIQLESVAGGIGEEESAVSNKASSLDSISASHLFSCSSRSMSFSISFVRLSLSCSRLSNSSSLIRASMVGCQFNFAKKRRHGGKEERNSDLLIDLELEESEEIDMAVSSEKADQSNQQTCRHGRPSHGIQRGRDLCRNSSAGIDYRLHQFSEARQLPNNCR
jgi:hypothetical protein